MHAILTVAMVLALCGTPVSASEDPPDGVTPPVRLHPTKIPPPKVLANARFRVRMLYGTHIEPDGSVGVIDLLLCATQDAREREFKNAPKEVCEPIDLEVRNELSKWKYRPAVKDGKAVAFDLVVKVDLVPSGAE